MAPQLGPQQDVSHPAFREMHDLGIQVVRCCSSSARSNASTSSRGHHPRGRTCPDSAAPGGPVAPSTHSRNSPRSIAAADGSEDRCHQFQGLGQRVLAGDGQPFEVFCLEQDLFPAILQRGSEERQLMVFAASQVWSVSGDSGKPIPRSSGDGSPPVAMMPPQTDLVVQGFE